MTTPDEYPEDEFDVAGRDRSPQGVHRGARPLWRTLLPVLAVIVLAPLLAWGAIGLLGDTAGPEPTPTPTAGPTETSDPGEDEAPEEPEEETTPEETTAEDIQYDATVTVLNGAGVAGLAGAAAEELIAEGFTDVATDDYGFEAPTVTTLYYNNAELQPTAEAVAETLGVTEVVESADATVSIAVVLRPDFSG